MPGGMRVRHNHHIAVRWWIGLALLVWMVTAVAGVRAATDGEELPVVEVGKPAPDITFTTLDGATRQLSEFRGRPVMLWFITTWCPSCTASAQLLDRRIGELEGTDLMIIVLKLYNNLGYEGPPLEEFITTNAPRLRNHPQVLWGEADFNVSVIYDPQGITDIYWLIDRDGIVWGSETAPSATFTTILDFAELQ